MKKIVSLSMLLCFVICAFAQENNRIPAKGLAVFSGDGQFKPYDFSRHEVGDNDIQIEILYAGICHSDVHHVRQDWGKEEFPMVPGHEIAGRVVKVGKNVTKFKLGDYAGIGCLVNSCGYCDYCKKGLEQYCKEAVLTYHDHDQFQRLFKHDYRNRKICDYYSSKCRSEKGCSASMCRYYYLFANTLCRRKKR